MGRRFVRSKPTQYGRHRFRSRLEAKWAVFFDTLGIDVVYEPTLFTVGFCSNVKRVSTYRTEQSFRFSRRVGYLPDFYYGQMSAWLEIKPLPPTKREQWKAANLARVTGLNVFVLCGFPVVYKGTSLKQPPKIFQYRYDNGKYFKRADMFWAVCDGCGLAMLLSPRETMPAHAGCRHRVPAWSYPTAAYLTGATYVF